MILELLLLIPIVGALIIWALPKLAKQIATLTTFAALVGGILTLPLFAYQKTFQFTSEYLIGEFVGIPISFHLGVDGISYVMVLLTLLLGFVSVLISWREITEKQPSYYIVLLLILPAIMGVFMSLDLIVFFIFWEIVLILMFLLILYWGHENRKYAAMKFLIFTGLASVGLLFAIILLAINTGSVSFLADMSVIPQGMSTIIFLLALVAFFVKIPIVPFHTWLPDAHVQAPTAASVLLAGVLLKMGAYGLIRFAGFFPDVVQEYRYMLFVFGTVTLIYGALVCLAQYNLKRLIAYSSVNHMGFVLLGIASGSALGLTGAVFEMVSHGLIAALLFGLAGAVHQVTHTYDLNVLKGIISQTPRLAWLLLIAALAGMGLPTMTGFIAEFLILVASFQTFGKSAVILLFGVLLTGSYMIRVIYKLCFGKSSLQASDKMVELLPFILLVAATIILGTLPFLLLKIIRASPLM